VGDEDEACKARPCSWDMHCAAEELDLALLRGRKERNLLLLLVTRNVFCWLLIGVTRSLLYVLFYTTSYLNYPQSTG
jgi:hypothetical protein